MISLATDTMKHRLMRCFTKSSIVGDILSSGSTKLTARRVMMIRIGWLQCRTRDASKTVLVRSLKRSITPKIR